MTAFRFRILSLLIAMSVVVPMGAGAAEPASEDAHGEEAADGDGAKKKGKDEVALTCSEELVGDWTIAYDAFAFRVMNAEAEIEWKIRTHLDPESTHGLLIKVQRPRRTSGYVRSPELDIWYNPPRIKLHNTHGNEYHAFGKALSHSYDRAIGFGMRQIWLEPDEFWYPHEDAFTVQISQMDARKAMTFEKTLATTEQKLRVELYAPMYSHSEPVGYGELTDTPGLAEAMKVAAYKNHELWGMDAECRMGPATLAPVEAAKSSSGH